MPDARSHRLYVSPDGEYLEMTCDPRPNWVRLDKLAKVWRRPSENAAEQLERRSGVVITDEGFTANVIEGEKH